MGWNYLSIPKLKRCSRWRLGKDKKLHPTHHWTCVYLSMLSLKLDIAFHMVLILVFHNHCFKGCKLYLYPKPYEWNIHFYFSHISMCSFAVYLIGQVLLLYSPVFYRVKYSSAMKRDTHDLNFELTKDHRSYWIRLDDWDSFSVL